ncbi:MAG: hypothetical protein ABIO19_14520 [Burkholderiaceae bacterium]
MAEIMAGKETAQTVAQGKFIEQKHPFNTRSILKRMTICNSNQK